MTTRALNFSYQHPSSHPRPFPQTFHDAEERGETLSAVSGD